MAQVQPGGKGHGDPKFSLVFIINGEDVSVDVSPHQQLHVARRKALEATGNTGRPEAEWEVRTEAGVVLSPDATVESSGLKPGTRLLLSLRVAAGGNRCSSTRR